MKLITIIFPLLLITACNVENSTSEDVSVGKTSNSVDEVRQHAEALLAGGEFSLEVALIQHQMYDSINSPIDTTRVYYLNVAKFLIKKGDALLNKHLGNNLIIFLNARPKEFIESFYKTDNNHIYEVGTTMGAYIANYVPDKEQAVLKIKEGFAKNIQKGNIEQINLENQIMKAVRQTIKTLGHSR